MIHGKLLFVAVVFAVFVSSQVTWANPPNHVNLPDQAAQGVTKHERKLKPGSRSGLIKTNHDIYDCNKDDISISVVLPHSLKAYWEGDADAYLVVFQIPVDASSDDVAMCHMKLDDPPAHPTPPPEEAEEHQQHILRNVDLADFDCENLEGDYQIALILTKLNILDPFMIKNWYNGFQGLVAVSKISFVVSGSD